MNFTQLLTTLCDFSRKIDNENFTGSDFIKLQKLEPDIINGYQARDFNHKYYVILCELFSLLMVSGRALLKERGKLH